METVNHEYYVSLEVAKLLKEAGFNWKVRYMYRNNNPTLCICTESPYRNVPKLNKCPMYWQYAAPTLEIAQRWLREVKGIEFDLCWHMTLDNQYKYAYAIKIKSIWKGLDKGKEIEVPSMDCLEAETCFNTFEEAQEAGIKKAVEILLKEGK